MDIQITFKDFKTEEKYLALQNKFARHSELNNTTEDDFIKVIKQDFQINYKTVNPITYEEDYIYLSFYNDFLIPRIQKLAKRFIDFFNHKLEEKVIIEREKIKAYSEIQLKKFFKLEYAIRNSNYLEKKINILIINQIQIIVDYLKQVHILPDYLIDDKLKFNLNKTDVLVLFTLLREKGIINAPFDSELGLFIEKYFSCKSNDTYASIKNAKGVVNDIKNFNRPIEKSIVRLKKIFKNNEFYELEIH
jgi:hypothetical protein